MPPVATSPPLTDPTALARIQAAHNPPADAAAGSAFVAARANVRLLHTDGGATRSPSNLAFGGQVLGTWAQNQSGIEGMRGTHSAYNAYAFGLASGGIISRLYAPSGKAGNSCVEVGTENTPPSISRVFAYDWCDGSPNGTFHYVLQLNNYYSSYIATINGVPSYTFQTLKNPDGRWTVYLYNFLSSQFEAQYTTATGTYVQSPVFPVVNQVAFWDYFEPKYDQGSACMGTPTVISSDLAEYSPSRGWMSLDVVPGAENNSTRMSGTCYNYDDGSGLGFFYVMTAYGNAMWRVDSWASQPPPPPPPPPPSCDPTLTCCDPLDPSCCTAVACLVPCIGSDCPCPTELTNNLPKCGPGAIIYSDRRRPISSTAGSRTAPDASNPMAVPPDVRLVDRVTRR